MLFSIGLGLIFLFLFRVVARKASTGVPAGLQNFVEWVIDSSTTRCAAPSPIRMHWLRRCADRVHVGVPDET